MYFAQLYLLIITFKVHFLLEFLEFILASLSIFHHFLINLIEFKVKILIVFFIKLIICSVYSSPFFLFLHLHISSEFYTYLKASPFLLLAGNSKLNLLHLNILINLILPFRCELLTLPWSSNRINCLLWCNCTQCLCLWILS
jgi:hypothetical protein